jgi:23S rRNA (pseudouridine1915-N3)-methyltransferase
MKITVICVGKLKEKYLKQAIDEYSKRLSRYCKLEIVEVADEKAPESMSAGEEAVVKLKEGEKILKNIKENAYVIALAIEGKQLSSEGLAEEMERLGVGGNSHLIFVIGGSLGLSDEVLTRANDLLSFSKMTFPHQLMRVILLEQIYRGYRINSGAPYHK